MAQPRKELPQKTVDEWNEMMAAAQLIRLGKGRIMIKRIHEKKVRFVRPI